MNIKMIAVAFQILFFLNTGIFGDDNSGEKLKAIEMSIKEEAIKALHECAKEWGITPEQIARIMNLTDQEKKLIWRYIEERNHIFGQHDHASGFPIALMRKVADRNGIDVGNIALEKSKDSYVNNTLGDSHAFATASYYCGNKSSYTKWTNRSTNRTWYEYNKNSSLDQYIDTDGNYGFKNNYHQQLITIYPSFDRLPLDEQEAVLIHELEHIIQRHCFTKGLFLSLVVDNKKIPTVRVNKSETAQRWKNAREKEANILPAVRDAGVAELFVSVCDKKNRSFFSDTECDLLRDIDKIHRTKH